MVLSASSVDGPTSTTTTTPTPSCSRQLIWVAIGLPLRLGRLAAAACAWLRALAWPGAARRARAARADPDPARRRRSTATRTGSASARSPIQPSEIAKLAIVLWAAHVYARKERRLGSLHQLLVPVVPGLLRGHRRWSCSAARPRHRPGAASRSCSAMLWVVGAPARLFAPRPRRSSGVAALYLATTDAERRAAADQLHRPVQGLPRRRLAAGPRPLRALHAAAGSARGIGASRQKWGDLPEAHTDFIFAVLGEELGLVGTLLVIGALPDHRLRRDPGRAATPRTRSSATRPSASWSGCSAR